jgi:hypothetical protein
MPRKQEPVIRLSAPDEFVVATTDVFKSGHYIYRGTRVPRSHVCVRELPSAFEVRYRLDQEVRDDGE